VGILTSCELDSSGSEICHSLDRRAPRSPRDLLEPRRSGLRPIAISETQSRIDQEPEERRRRKTISDGVEPPLEKRIRERGLSPRQVQRRGCLRRHSVRLQAR
jgi:hypothetical protein